MQELEVAANTANSAELALFSGDRVDARGEPLKSAAQTQ
jgi:hypothetical protein